MNVTVDRRRGRLLLTALLCTFVLVRLWLQAAPDSDLNIGSWNVHHLFTGLLLVAAGGPPLVLLSGRSWWLDVAAIAFGAGLALALDEWVYLIVTDGSNAAYLLPVSWWGGVILVGLAALWVVVLLRRGERRPE